VLLAATCGWALTFPLVKNALADASPNLFLTGRFVLGAAGAALFAGRNLRHLPSLRYGALLGLMLWLGFALNTAGLELTTATRSGFISSLCVVLTPLLAVAVFRQRAHPAAYAGAGLAAVGLFVLSARSFFEGGNILGDALTTASAIAYAFHILYTERFAPAVVPSAAVVAQLAVVALLSALMLPFEPLRFRPTPALFGALAFTGIFASALFIRMQLWSQARTTAVRAALIFSLEPIFAAVFTWFILAEPVHPDTFIGGGLILLGIVASELWPRWEARRAASVEALQ